MEKYKIEYFELKNKLPEIKKDIQKILEKYDFDNDWYGQSNKLMEVLSWLYQERKWTWYQWTSVLDNYRESSWVPLEDLEAIMELFIERKEAKKRMWFIKWLIIRKFLYY